MPNMCRVGFDELHRRLCGALLMLQQRGRHCQALAVRRAWYWWVSEQRVGLA
jgi:hypothetical protein